MTLYFEKDKRFAPGVGHLEELQPVSYGSDGRKVIGNRMKVVIPYVFGCGP